MAKTQTCNSCGLIKDIDDFYSYMKKYTYESRLFIEKVCIECIRLESDTRRKILNAGKEKPIKKEKSLAECIAEKEKSEEYHRQYRASHREELNEKQRQARQDDPEKSRAANRKSWAKHREQRRADDKIRYEENREYKLEKGHEYNLKHKEEKKEYNHQYYIENKDAIIAQGNEYKKNRYHTDMSYRLYKRISKLIRKSFFKDGHSILKFLSFSIEELKYHFEAQFEPWMNWNNYGAYQSQDWNDNDPLTWKWNIDHIIPRSDLEFSSFEDENFKKCWALENLRPYSAKQNLLDGVSRIRHKKDNK